MKSLHLITHLNIIFFPNYILQRRVVGVDSRLVTPLWETFGEMERGSRKEDGKHEDTDRGEKTEGGTWAVRETRSKFGSQLLCAIATKKTILALE